MLSSEILAALETAGVNPIALQERLPAIQKTLEAGLGAGLLPAITIAGVPFRAFFGPALFAIKIGGVEFAPSFPQNPERNSIVEDGADFKNGCKWKLKTETFVSTSPALSPGCVMHNYKTVVTLTRVCEPPLKGDTKTSFRITTTGPHCGNPTATPPVPPASPKTDSKLVGTGPDKDGNTKTDVEQPDGTKVSTTALSDGTSVTTTVTYPDGTQVTLTLPQQ